MSAREETATGSIVDAVLSYAKLGWRVLPVHCPLPSDGAVACSCKNPDCSSIGKHPYESGWTKAACVTEETIRGWWKRWPSANVGIATGVESGIIAIDVDCGEGKRGTQSLHELQSKYGKLPPTVEAVSGGGGQHFYFQHPGKEIRVQGRPLSPDFPHIDVRGDGNQILAPPSRHQSGTLYAWNESRAPHETLLAPCPSWLLQLVQNKAEDRIDVINGKDVPIGQRHTYLLKQSVRLAAKNLSPTELAGALQSLRDANCQSPSSADTDKQLANMARTALKKKGKDTARFRIVGDLRDLIAANLAPPEELVEGFLMKQDFCLLSGPAYSGKTWLMIDLALALAAGRPWLGHAAKESRVGIFPRELPDALFLNRVETLLGEKWERSVELPLFKRFFPAVAPLWVQGHVDLVDDLSAIKDFCQFRQLDCLIVDPLSRVHTVNENVAAELMPVLRGVDELREECGVAVVIIHHHRKGVPGKTEDSLSSPRGSTLLSTCPTVNAAIQTLGRQFRKVDIRRNCGRASDPFYIKERSEGGFVLSEKPLRGKEVGDANRAHVLSAIERGANSYEEVAVGTELADRTVRQHVKALAEDGKVAIEKDGKKVSLHLAQWKAPEQRPIWGDDGAELL